MCDEEVGWQVENQFVTEMVDGIKASMDQQLLLQQRNERRRRGEKGKKGGDESSTVES